MKYCETCESEHSTRQNLARSYLTRATTRTLPLNYIKPRPTYTSQYTKSTLSCQCMCKCDKSATQPHTAILQAHTAMPHHVTASKPRNATRHINTKYNTITIRLTNREKPIIVKSADRETLIKMLKEIVAKI